MDRCAYLNFFYKWLDMIPLSLQVIFVLTHLPSILYSMSPGDCPTVPDGDYPTTPVSHGVDI